jgi:magnesium transporter
MNIQELYDKIEALLVKRDREGLKRLLGEVEPADSAEAFQLFSLPQQLLLLSMLSVEDAADIFEELDEEAQRALLENMEEPRLGALLDELDPDERADLIAYFPEEIRAKFLSLMDRKEAEDTRRLISYPPDTAGGRMTTDYAWVKEEMTVAEAMKVLRREAKEVETIYYIYVIDEGGKLKGMVSLKYLVFARPDEKIKDIMLKKIISVPVNMDQEEVAREYIAKYDYLALPVVGKDGVLLGIITVDDMIDVLKEENSEDMHRFGAAGSSSESYMSSRVVTVARKRFTWLFFLVVASLFSVMVMDSYSGVLSSIIALAFFIPLLMNTAGNAGTQAATIAVRGLATGELRIGDIWKVARKELLVGIVVGGALGVLGLLRAFLLDGSSALGLTVGITMILAVVVSTTIGGALPFIFKRMGFDPALMSGPLLTTIVDISTLAIYFELARFIFGTL